LRTSLVEFFTKKYFHRPETPADELQRQANVGESMENLVKGGWMNLLAEHVLDPMQQEAFESFKKLVPSDFDSICQAQKLGQVVDEIKKRVDRKIELGRQARKRIIELATEENQNE
jgi:hypothetical protein